MRAERSHGVRESGRARRGSEVAGKEPVGVERRGMVTEGGARGEGGREQW